MSLLVVMSFHGLQEPVSGLYSNQLRAGTSYRNNIISKENILIHFEKNEKVRIP